MFFFQIAINYSGRAISDKSLKPNQAILITIQSNLGLLNYYGKCILYVSANLQKDYKLLHKIKFI